MNIVDICLLVAIVAHGWADKVVDAAKSHGATGATIINGRGIGKGERQKILGLEIEPEQECVFIILDRQIADSVLNEIYEAVGLDEPGKGLAFIVPIEHVIGLHNEENEPVDLLKKQIETEKLEREEKQEAEDKKSGEVDTRKEVLNIWTDPELIPDNFKVEDSD